MTEVIVDGLLQAFIIDHSSHKDFRFTLSKISKGSQMNEYDVHVLGAKCKHDGVKMTIENEDHFL